MDPVQAQPTRTLSAEILEYLYRAGKDGLGDVAVATIAAALLRPEAELQRRLKVLEDEGWVMLQAGPSGLHGRLTGAGKREALRGLDFAAAAQTADLPELSAIAKDAELFHAQVERVTRQLVATARQHLPERQWQLYRDAAATFTQQLRVSRAEPAGFHGSLATLALLGEIQGTPKQIVAIGPTLYQLLKLLSLR